MRLLNFTQSGLYKFCSYNINQIEFYPTEPENLGTYQVIIELKDKNIKPKENLYSFYVTVVPKRKNLNNSDSIYIAEP